MWKYLPAVLSCAVETKQQCPFNRVLTGTLPIYSKLPALQTQDLAGLIVCRLFLVCFFNETRGTIVYSFLLPVRYMCAAQVGGRVVVETEPFASLAALMTCNCTAESCELLFLGVI